MILFDNESRLFKLIDIFVENKVINLKLIVKKLNIGVKTFKNDIKQLNNMIEPYASIQFNGQEYTLCVFNESEFEIIYNKILGCNYVFTSSKNRKLYIMYRLLNNVCCFIDDLAEHMSVGRTTLIRDLSNLRNNLKDYKISILGKTRNGIYLFGNEINIRKYIIEKMYKYLFKESLLKESSLSFLKCELINFGLDLNSVNLVIKYIDVTLYRILSGNFINSKDIKEIYELKDTVFYSIVNKILQIVEKDLGVCFDLNDKLFISIPFSCFRTSQNLNLASIDYEIKNISKELINYINNKLNINIVFGNMIEDFERHIGFMINRARYNIKIENIMASEIKSCYFFAYKVAEIAVEFIEKRLNVNIDEEETGFLAIYFSLFMSENSNLKKFKVALICDLGTLMSKLIHNRLKSILKFNIEIDLFSTQNIDFDKISTYDFLVSSVKINRQVNLPVFYFKEIFDEYVFLKKLSKLSHFKYFDKPRINGVESIIFSILNEKNFMFFEDKYSYKQILNFMVDNLYVDDCLDDGFFDILIEKENLYSTIFNDNVAIPHAVNYRSDKLILSLGVLGNSSSDSDLKIVLLVCILDSRDFDEMILIKIYDEILYISNNINLIDSMTKIKTYRDMILYFMKVKYDFYRGLI